MMWWYIGVCSGSGRVLQSLRRNVRVSLPNRPCASKMIGTTSCGAYLRFLYRSACSAAKPGVIDETWLPAKAACVKAEVTMMSRCTGEAAVCQVMSVRLARLFPSSWWMLWFAAVGVAVFGRICSMRGVCPVMFSMILASLSLMALCLALR